MAWPNLSNNSNTLGSVPGGWEWVVTEIIKKGKDSRNNNFVHLRIDSGFLPQSPTQTIFSRESTFWLTLTDPLPPLICRILSQKSWWPFIRPILFYSNIGWASSSKQAGSGMFFINQKFVTIGIDIKWNSFNKASSTLLKKKQIKEAQGEISSPSTNPATHNNKSSPSPQQNQTSVSGSIPSGGNEFDEEFGGFDDENLRALAAYEMAADDFKQTKLPDYFRWGCKQGMQEAGSQNEVESQYNELITSKLRGFKRLAIIGSHVFAVYMLPVLEIGQLWNVCIHKRRKWFSKAFVEGDPDCMVFPMSCAPIPCIDGSLQRQKNVLVPMILRDLPVHLRDYIIDQQSMAEQNAVASFYALDNMLSVCGSTGATGSSRWARRTPRSPHSTSSARRVPRGLLRFSRRVSGRLLRRLLRLLRGLLRVPRGFFRLAFASIRSCRS